MAVTVSGGVAHGLSALSHSELQAARQALAKLKFPGVGLGSHLGSTTESATVSSGSTAARLAMPALIHSHGSDTFMGGVRSASPVVGASIGNDTVVSGSAAKFGGHTIAGRGVQHFNLTSDTINVAGTTATSLQTSQLRGTATAHTVTLADKTTIKIAGLSAHDISKLHHS